MTTHQFTVVDLGTQLGKHRRFAVWDASVSRFWKINNHQTWRYVDDLLADFQEHLPSEKFQVVFHAQRDELARQALLLGFDQDL